MRYVVWKNWRFQWRWRLVANNGEVLASGEGYRNKVDCVSAIGLVKQSEGARIVYED